LSQILFLSYDFIISAACVFDISFLCTCRKAAEKFLSILIAIGQAAANLFMGMYGPLGLLGVGNSILIIAQLCFASILMMCLDELLQVGYGLGSGISLFTATHMW
jgi:protein transport protein SEC61 subunit alpha